MSEDKVKKCSKCRTVKPLKNFDEGKALCQKCSEYKQRYRENHREELRQKAKEHYEQYKGQNLRNRKKRLNVQFVRLTFHEIKC